MTNILLKSLFIITIAFLSTITQAEQVFKFVDPVSYFANHTTQLKAIKYNLERYKQASIIGTSGIGKTQLARMYAYQNKDSYHIIWFFDCAIDINNQFVKLAKAINSTFNAKLSEEQLLAKQEVLHYLETTPNWLLVFDNLKINENYKLQSLIEWEHNGNIIFCSQDSLMLNHLIEVPRLQSKDAKDLVSSILYNKNSNVIESLVKESQGYPILLVQAVQVINNMKGLNYNQYKSMIQETNNKIYFNIDLCKKELTPTAVNLLEKISLINNHSFSKSFLKMLINNQYTLDDDIYQLLKYGLILNINTDTENPIFEMHDIVAKTVQSSNMIDRNNAHLNEIIFNVLIKSFPVGVVQKQTTRTSSTFNENLQVILKNVQKFQVKTLMEAKLREEVLVTSLNNRKYDLASQMTEWFINQEKDNKFIVNKMNDIEKYIYASYLNAIGGYYNFALSNPVEAIYYFLRAREVISTLEGYESTKFNISYQVLRTQLDLGQVENAQNSFNQISEIYNLGTKNKTIDLFDDSFLHVAKTRLLVAQEKYQEALKQVDEALKSFKQAGLNDNNVLLESSYQLKIEALNQLYRFKEAYSLILWLYDVYKPILSPNHEIFANLYTKMAISQYGLSSYKESLENANKAITIFIKVRNINEEDIHLVNDAQLAKALIIKADSLSALNEIEQALKFYEKAEAIYNNVHADNVSTLSNFRHLLVSAIKTACKKPNKQNEFWYKHFYNRLRTVYGVNCKEVEEVNKDCSNKY